MTKFLLRGIIFEKMENGFPIKTVYECVKEKKKYPLGPTILSMGDAEISINRYASLSLPEK